MYGKKHSIVCIDDPLSRTCLSCTENIHRHNDNIYTMNYIAYPSCSFSPSISTLTDIHESERSITMVDGKLSSIMFHWYSIHAPHMWDSGLILVVTGELEVPVKALVGSMITCSRMTCSVRSVRYMYLIIMAVTSCTDHEI